MAYTVTKIDAGRWQVTSPEGTNLGVKATRRAALTLARALAGWRFKVELA